MNQEQLDTDQLVARAADGNQTARNDLLQRHRMRLLRMVQMRMDRRLSSRFDASDVIQEALVTAERRLCQYLEDQPIPFYPWIRKIAWEHLLKLQEQHFAQKRSIRREAGKLPVADESLDELANCLAGNLTAPSERVMRNEARRRVREAMKSLKPNEREVLELLYLEQLKAAEIATILDISPTTARTRHFRAIQHLSTILKKTD